MGFGVLWAPPLVSCGHPLVSCGQPWVPYGHLLVSCGHPHWGLVGLLPASYLPPTCLRTCLRAELSSSVGCLHIHFWLGSGLALVLPRHMCAHTSFGQTSQVDERQQSTEAHVAKIIAVPKQKRSGAWSKALCRCRSHCWVSMPLISPY